MTTLVGLHVPGMGSFIGADRMVSSGACRSTPTQKWFIHPTNGFACAAAGPARALDVITEYGLALLKDRPTPMVFRDRAMEALMKEGFQAAVDGAGFPMWPLALMLASPKGVWSYDPTLFVTQAQPDVLIAEGSGADYAIGAAWALRDTLGPQDRVGQAVLAGMTFDESSGDGAQVWHLFPQKDESRTKRRTTKPAVPPVSQKAPPAAKKKPPENSRHRPRANKSLLA